MNFAMNLETEMPSTEDDTIKQETRFETILISPVSENSVIVAMKKASKLYFRGILDISVISGKAEVLGYYIKSKVPSVRAYSLQGSCALYITPGPKSKIPEGFELSELTKKGLSIMKATQIYNFSKPSGVILMLEGTTCEDYSRFKIVESCGFEVMPKIYSSEDDSLNEAEVILNCVLDFERGNKVKDKLVIDQFWRDLGLEFKGEMKTGRVPHVALCGGKGVGKSTMARYVVNQFINLGKKCLYIDCDVGQCEFTPPGSISISLIDKPLLGPNYSHSIVPLRCYFIGVVDPLKCLDTYLDTAKYVMNLCYQSPDLIDLPWYMNTMGFPTGLGLQITVSVLQFFMPSTLVQLQSENDARNYLSLTSNFISSYKIDKDPINLDYRHLETYAPSEQRKLRRISGEFLGPSSKRDIMMLSYFGRYIDNFSSVVPILFRKNCAPDIQLTKFGVGCLVGLLQKIDTELKLNCIGFGIVRGIDVATQSLLILTPIDITLTRVHDINVGYMKIPTVIQTYTNDKLGGKIPFITIRNSQSNAFRPAKRRQKHNRKK